MCILVVDDEPIIRMLLEDSLLEAGHEVMTASHGPGALQILADHPRHFTCLVTDFWMPFGPSGADLIRHMRRAYPLIPMVLATAMGSAVTPRWRADHHVALLEKP